MDDSARTATSPVADGASAPEERWPKRYTLVGLCFSAVFICYLDRVNISVAALAMQETYGWSETVKGFVLSSFFVGYLLFQIPSGYLANRFGGKVVLGLAVVWWSACTIITPAAAAISLAALVAARIAMGLGEAATFPAAYNLYGRWVPEAERSRSVTLLLSGIPLGTPFALAASGWIIGVFGWPAVFYIFGAVGLVWAVIWFARVHDDPASHPGISASERSLLTANQGVNTSSDPVPYKELFSKPAVWALVINHFCSNWGLYMLLTWLPSYFRNAQGLTIANAGLFSAAPWLTMFVMSNVAAWIADSMRKSGVDLTFIRKLMQLIGLLGSAAFLFLAKDVSNATIALMLMCGALGTLAFTWSGFSPNHLDIAPRYAGVLMGVTNTAGTIPGILGVLVTGWLVDATGSYASAFLLAAAVNIFGAMIWWMFATAKRVME